MRKSRVARCPRLSPHVPRQSPALRAVVPIPRVAHFRILCAAVTAFAVPALHSHATATVRSALHRHDLAAFTLLGAYEANGALRQSPRLEGFASYLVCAETGLAGDPTCPTRGDLCADGSCHLFFVSARNAFVAEEHRGSTRAQAYSSLHGLPPLSLQLSGAPHARAVLDLCRSVDSIVSIDLSFTAVDDRDLRMVASMPNLRGLRLEGCTAITDEGAAFLSGLRDLRYLDLTDTRISEEGLLAICRLPDLRGLRLPPNVTSDVMRAVVSTSRELRFIGLNSIALDDDAVSLLSSLEHLERLEIASPVSNRALSWVPRSKLSHLYWVIHRGALDSGGLPLVVAPSSIRQLSVVGGVLADRDFKAIAGMEKLDRLELVHCRPSEAGLAHVVRNDQLTSLTIKDSVLPGGVLPLLRDSGSMRQLVLHGLVGLHDDHVIALAANRSVRFVEVSLPIGVGLTTEALDQVSVMRPDCTFVWGDRRWFPARGASKQ